MTTKRRDLIELIKKNEQEELEEIIIDNQNLQYLKHIFGELQSTPTLVCLDMHGVTDLFETTDKIDIPHTKCVLSYVGYGHHSQMRVKVRQGIRERILSGQIEFGIMVFVKLRRIDESTDFLGTKKTVIELLLEQKPDVGKIYFIDDSKIQIETVDSINSVLVRSIFFDSKLYDKHQLLDIIKRCN